MVFWRYRLLKPAKDALADRCLHRLSILHLASPTMTPDLFVNAILSSPLRPLSYRLNPIEHSADLARWANLQLHVMVSESSTY